MAKDIAYKVTVDTSEVDEGVERTTENVENLGNATKKTSKEMKSGFKAAEQGTKKLGTSIGSILKSLGLLGAAMAVWEFMKDILQRNQKFMDALNTATTAFEILLYKLFEAVEPLGNVMKSAFEDPKTAVTDLWDAIKENLINRLEGFIDSWKAVGRAIKGVMNLDWDEVKKGAEDYGKALIKVGTGLDEEQQKKIVDGIKDFIKETKEATVSAVEQADALVKLRNEVKLLEASQQEIQLTYQREAEIQRQIRDDISLTIAERQAANDRLAEILDEQVEIELNLANKRLELAEREAALNKGNIDLQAEVLRARGEVAEVEERIISQRSEQLVNEKALEQELFDFRNQLRLEELEGREREVEELQQHYDELAEIARRAGEDMFEVEAARARALTELNKEFYEEDKKNAIKAEKEKADAQAKIDAAKVQAASDIGGALGSIAQSVEQQGKAGLVTSKILATAQIAIDTAKAISGAIAQAQSVPFPGNIAAIATGVAAVIAGIVSAVNTLKSANVSGGGTPSVPNASSVTASATAPSINPVTTNTTELGNTQQAELAPVQAYVVETQLTGTQNEVGQIEGQAEFGG